MNKISLVSRRKDKSFDVPTKASLRSQERLAAQDSLAINPAPPPPAAQPDVSISSQEGVPTVDLQLPADNRLDVGALSEEYLKEKDSAQVLAIMKKEKIGEKWGLKLQFLPEQSARMLSAKELAIMFGVSHHTVYSLLKKGAIRGYKVGRSWRFKWPEVLETLNDSLKSTDHSAPIKSGR